MRCPRCDWLLHVGEGELQLRRCPNCRGAWLDRREVEDLLVRTRPVDAPEATASTGSTGWRAEIQFYDFG